MATFDLTIDVESKRLVAGFLSTRATSAPAAVFGDKPTISVRLVEPNGNNADLPWRDLDLTGQTVRVGIGNEGGDPTGGTFTLTYAGSTTSALGYNATATEVEDALNIIGCPCDVTQYSGGGYKLIFNIKGANPLVSADTSGLSPATGAYIEEAVAGDASTYAVQVINIETQPAAYIELTDDLDAPVATVTEVRPGVSNTTSEIQRVSISGDPYDGTYTLTIGGESTGNLEVDSSSDDIKAAIEYLPSIGEGGVTVTGSGLLYTLEFSNTLGDVGTATADTSNLSTPVGKKGVLDLNTVGMLELLDGNPAVTSTLEVVRYTTATSVSQTVYQGDIRCKQDVIPNSPASSTPLPTYPDIEEAVTYSDQSGLAKSDGDKTQARENIQAMSSAGWNGNVAVTTNMNLEASHVGKIMSLGAGTLTIMPLAGDLLNTGGRVGISVGPGATHTVQVHATTAVYDGKTAISGGGSFDVKEGLHVLHQYAPGFWRLVRDIPFEDGDKEKLDLLLPPITVADNDEKRGLTGLAAGQEVIIEDEGNRRERYLGGGESDEANWRLAEAQVVNDFFDSVTVTDGRIYISDLVRALSGFRITEDGDGLALLEILGAAQGVAGIQLRENIGAGRISGALVRFNGVENRLELSGETQPTASPASLVRSLAMTVDRSTGNVGFHSAVDFSGATVSGISIAGSGYNGGIAIMTDSHLFTYGNTERYATAMSEVRSLGASCVIHLGDLVDDNFDGSDEPAEGYLSFLTRHINHSGLPWYQCYGNHDASSNATVLTAQGKLPDAYKLDHNDGASHLGYYTFLKEGIHFIVLAATLETGDATGDYDISATQISWLQSTLDGITGSDKRVVVCCHVCPANEAGDDAPFSGVSHRLVTTTASTVRSKLETWQATQGKVLCVLSGHDHISRKKTMGGIDYLSINQVGTGSADGRDSSYADYPRFGLSLLQWDEGSNTLTITGYNGNTSYSIDKS